MNQSFCIRCIFESKFAEGCIFNVTNTVTKSFKTTAILKKQSTDVSVEGCLTNLPNGDYTVYVFDVEKGLPVTALPAIVLYNIAINAMDITS